MNEFCQLLSGLPLALEFSWGQVAQLRMDAFVHVDSIEKATYLMDSVSIAFIIRYVNL